MGKPSKGTKADKRLKPNKSAAKPATGGAKFAAARFAKKKT